MALYCTIQVYESNGSQKVWEIKNTKVMIAIVKLLAFLDFKMTSEILKNINDEKNQLNNSGMEDGRQF